MPLIVLLTISRKPKSVPTPLKNITIPSYEALVKTIENALEEKEREEFTRLKVIKSRDLNKKNSNHWTILLFISYMFFIILML